MPYEFHYKRLVYWQDTDMAGIIHFTNYFRYMEEAETEFHRSMGVHALEVRRQEGVLWPRVSASCDFIKPVTFGDELDVHLWIQKIGRSSIHYEVSFRHQNEEVAKGKLVIVCVKKSPDGQMASVPIPSILNKQLTVAPFVESGSDTRAL